jgi:hypothetical protein
MRPLGEGGTSVILSRRNADERANHGGQRKFVRHVNKYYNIAK